MDSAFITRKKKKRKPNYFHFASNRKMASAPVSTPCSWLSPYANYHGSHGPVFGTSEYPSHVHPPSQLTSVCTSGFPVHSLQTPAPRHHPHASISYPPGNTGNDPEALWESRLSHNPQSDLPSAFTPTLQGLLLALPGYLPVPANHHLQEPLLGLSPVPIHNTAATGTILCCNPARSLGRHLHKRPGPPLQPSCLTWYFSHCAYHLVTSYRISSIYAVMVHRLGQGLVHQAATVIPTAYTGILVTGQPLVMHPVKHQLGS